ncbi:ent-kaurene oxidase [Sporormia fimetaria CBS 119925]|uniref:Ent-kaurene oxidase n=1 Tax=Sporormia fimetaria CBS 119925 TaxID=1340428 RepID=A0A6A6VGQ0_9PLEO|nr:ent-kaurene oxidase [Sporormia fimetaria CBS 119925]
METQHLVGVGHTLQTLAFAAIIFAGLWILPRLNLEAQIRRLPAYIYEGDKQSKRSTYETSAKKLYADGYQKFKDRVWRISGTEKLDTIVIPAKFLPEVRTLPDSVLSFPKAIEEFLFSKYTKVDTDEPISAHVVKADLTPALARLNPIIDAEVKQAMEEEMPPCEDWTPVYIYMKIVNAVAKVSGRIFVGPDLCRNKDYLDAAINYTLDLFSAQRKIQKMNPWLRPFLAPRLPEIKKLDQHRLKARAILEPVVRARRAAEKTDPDYKKPEDMLQWLMNRSSDHDRDTVEQIAMLQLSLTFAAIHTTSLTATNIFFTLAADTASIAPLREEIRRVTAENGGIMTYRALQQMEKLDSYMKEVMRFYPLGLTSFTRKVVRGFTLSNGQYLPAGANIEIPSHAIYNDSNNYENPDTFDGFRSYKLRQQGGATNHARNQFVTTNEQNLLFGYGRHACPGRFFAANEIKMILARTVLEYDFRNADGSQTRYANVYQGRTASPDAAKQLEFRKVVTA